RRLLHRRPVRSPDDAPLLEHGRDVQDVVRLLQPQRALPGRLLRDHHSEISATAAYLVLSSMRIASLLPSPTEIVCALGARDELVGVSHECDFPEGLGALPVLTRARLRPVRTSKAIDREVRALLADALAVYEIEEERLAAVEPDVIVTQDL